MVDDVQLTVEVEGMSRGLHGALAVPSGAGPWPGVVLIHEAFGLDDEMRKHVEHLARLGYLALMPDLYTEGGMRRCVSSTMRSLGTGRGRAYADIEAARAMLLADRRCTGKVGVIGFCMGGGFALMTADTGFDAASVNYGFLPSNLDAKLENACPVVASYPGKDRTLRGVNDRLDAALTRAGVPHDSKEYPNANHSFLNEGRNGPVLMRPLLRVAGLGPEPESAKDAWERIDGFFGEWLR